MENEKQPLEEQQTQTSEPAPREPETLESPAEETSLSASESSEQSPSPENQEEDLEDEDEDEEPQEPEYEKLFTLKYRIQLDDYYQFHLITGAPAVKKNKKRMTILGVIEVVVGLAFLLMLPYQESTGKMPFIIALLLVVMGAYGALYYRVFYHRTLRRVLKKQIAKTAYFKDDIRIDIYPNKFVEYNNSKSYETYWRTIKDVRYTDTLFMVMLTDTRCLLVPKGGLSQEDQDKFQAFLSQMAKNYEKPEMNV